VCDEFVSIPSILSGAKNYDLKFFKYGRKVAWIAQVSFIVLFMRRLRQNGPQKRGKTINFIQGCESALI
jgi:hypothetical protein